MTKRPMTASGGSTAGWTVLGYLGLAGFFAAEAALRRPGSAASLDASEGDRDTTRQIGRAYLAAATLPLVLSPAQPRLSRAVAPAGLALEASGLGLRLWSMATLGAAYTRTLRTEAEQQVVDAGPYRVVRHPGYLGSLLIWLGFGLTTRRLPVVVGVGVLVGRAYQRRIGAEEDLLGRDLPGYADYAQRTKRLIPFVW